MRFTPTTNWTNFSNSTVKKMQWKVYLRLNTLRSTTLNGATWSEITSYVTEMPDIKTQNEYEIGVFTADSISIKCNNKKYFKDNWFTGLSPYVEIKVTADIINGTTATSDTPSLFYGFVDLQNINYVTSSDSVEFSSYTIDELASRIPAENYNEQYTVKVSAADRVNFPGIPGVYITDTNVSSYACKVGSHSITYARSGATITLTFDGGTSQTTTFDGSLVLVNDKEDEKIQLFIVYADTVVLTSKIVKFIIDSPNSALPKNYVYGKSFSDFAKGLLNVIGITSSNVTIDTTTFSPHDSTNRASYINIPPNDNSIVGSRNAIITDGTNLFTGVGNRIYKRTTSSGDYTLFATLTTDHYVRRMWFNSTRNYIYILAEDVSGNTTTLKFVVYNTAGTLLHSDVSNTDFNNSNYNSYAVEIVDSASPSVHGFVYSIPGVTDGTTNKGNIALYNLTTTLYFPIDAFPGAYLLTTDYLFNRRGSFGFELAFSYGNGSTGTFIFTSSNAGTVTLGYNGADTTVAYYLYGGTTGTYTGDHLYWWDSTNSAVKRTTISGGTTTSIISATGLKCSFIDKVNSIIYVNDYANQKLYSISGVTATKVESYIMLLKHSFVYITDRYYGLDFVGGLYHFFTTISMSFIAPDYSGKTLRELLSDVCKAYNMTYTITSNKKAYIYRRGTNTGAISTTGNELDISPSEITDQTRNYKYSSGVELVEVSNGTVTQTYGLTGTGSTLAFGVTRFSDARKLTLTNNFIPSNLVDDLCYYIYQYYSIDRDVYDIPISTSKFEYEPFDGIKFYTEFDYLLSENLDELISEHSENLIYATDEKSGVIVGQTIQSNGITNFQVVA